MRRVIVFLKYPEPGQVKTRLAEAIGREAAARLARHFAEATLAALATLAGPGLPLTVCYAPAERGPDVAAWLGPGLDYAPQRGVDLGERMRHAFEDAFAAGAERAVLVGTDAPDRPVEFIREALLRLDEHDVVLGPALDGGYHLIAMGRHRFAPEAFADIDWSTPRVLAQTLDALRSARHTAYMLPPWRDIDDQAGLTDYLEAHPEAARLLDGHAADDDAIEDKSDGKPDESNSTPSGTDDTPSGRPNDTSNTKPDGSAPCNTKG